MTHEDQRLAEELEHRYPGLKLSVVNARVAGITRARVTQIINLTQLAPDIQEAILNLEPTTDPVPRFRERKVRTIAILPNWEKQRVLWKRLVKQTS